MTGIEKVPMTLAGYERLVEELKQLKTVERPAIIKAIAEARDHGDLSENAEYHAARERQSFIEGRVMELEAKISLAEVIDVKKLSGKTVTFAGLSLNGANAGNYALGTGTGTATITQKTLTYSGVTASNKVYDGSTVAATTGTAALAAALAADVGTRDRAALLRRLAGRREFLRDPVRQLHPIQNRRPLPFHFFHEPNQQQNNRDSN